MGIPVFHPDICINQYIPELYNQSIMKFIGLATLFFAAIALASPTVELSDLEKHEGCRRTSSL